MTSTPKIVKSKTIETEISDDDNSHAPIAQPFRPTPCCRLPKELTASLERSAASSTENKPEEEKKINNKEKFEKIVKPTVTENIIPLDKIEPSPPVVPTKTKRLTTIEKSSNLINPSNVAVPRNDFARTAPLNPDERPLVIATHLVPSLPIGLFEILADVIEVATGKAVSLIYEPRCNRPVAKDVVDIAFLPASDTWTDGCLLPVSFVFEHRLNKDQNPSVYVDVVVAPDCLIEEIIDLRGYRCALPDRRKKLGAAGLLFSHLKSKGENPTFFGNTLDSGSQVAALQMVAGKQAEVGVLESPVINYHKNTLPGVDSLYVLASLGPLPPYRIMFNKNLEVSVCHKIKDSLLTLKGDVAWMERLKPYGITGFAEYSEDRYDLEDIKNVVTSVPYY